MDSHMAGPMCVKRSEVVEGCRVSDLLRQKNFENSFFLFFYFYNFFPLGASLFLISACMTTYSALRTVALRHIYLIVEVSALNPLESCVRN